MNLIEADEINVGIMSPTQLFGAAKMKLFLPAFALVPCMHLEFAI